MIIIMERNATKVQVQKIIDLLKDNEVNGHTKLELIKSFDQVLAVELIREKVEVEANEDILKLIEARNEAKKKKDFELADSIRDDLYKKGIELIKTIVKIPTGFVTEMLDRTVALVYSRSGMATKRSLVVCQGTAVIDSDYRGEWFIPIHNDTWKEDLGVEAVLKKSNQTVKSEKQTSKRL